MNNNSSSEIISNSDNKAQNSISQSDRSEVAETESVISSKPNNNALESLKIAIAGGVVILTLAICILLSKENDVCFFSTCNEYSDSTATNLTSTLGDDFIAYAGGAASLLVLTTLVGVPLLPAVAISTGIWFLVRIIH